MGIWGPVRHRRRPRHCQTRTRLGVTLFDTAEIYGLGKSERILGEALGDDRTEVVVASKVFPVAPFPAVIRTASAPVRGGCS